jgi:hypothetical protein
MPKLYEDMQRSIVQGIRTEVEVAALGISIPSTTRGLPDGRTLGNADFAQRLTVA